MLLRLRLDAVILLDQIARLAHDGQRGQAEEVDLQQADRFDDAHFELRDDSSELSLSLVGRCSGVYSTNGRSEMTTPAACVPMLRTVPSTVLRRVEQRFTQSVESYSLLEFRHLLDRFADLHGLAGQVGHQLRHAIDVGQRHIQRAARVANRRARAQRAERDDLRDLVFAVLVDGVVDHLRAPIVGEVHVNIGHGDATGIEEALEDQACWAADRDW